MTAKRVTDLVVAVLLLALTGPVLVAAMAAIALTMGRPVVFRQTRTGLGMRRFGLHKLRTMTDGPGPDAVRLTRLGCFLRRSSIDELPGLIDVIRGRLSLVGPRPLLPRYEPFYSARERLRFTVRPGMTGLAQVSGRNTLAWADRLELDARYVEQQSYALDLRIMVRTLGRLLVGTGAVADPAGLMADLDAERAGAR